MALTINSTYVGIDSKHFVSPVMRAGRTLGVPGVTIKNNINYKGRITKLTTSGLVKAASCAWDPSCSLTLDEVWLNVKALEVNCELCKLDLMQDFIGSDMGCDDPLPADFLRYLLTVIGADVADALETMIWQGTSGANSFDGFETLMDASTGATTVVKVGTPVALTATNVISEIRRGIALAPSTILGRSDLLIYVGSKVYQLIKQALNDKTAASACGEDCVALDGITVFLAPGMSDGTYVIAEKSNMFFGTWNSSSLTHVKVKDMTEFLEENVRFAMCFFAGVAYAIPGEVVYYKGV